MTLECAIPQKFHRAVMGPKGSRIQQITRDYNVQIKFPDREENPGGSTCCRGLQRLSIPHWVTRCQCVGCICVDVCGRSPGDRMC